jgi:hypothetical protein
MAADGIAAVAAITSTALAPMVIMAVSAGLITTAVYRVYPTAIAPPM